MSTVDSEYENIYADEEFTRNMDTGVFYTTNRIVETRRKDSYVHVPRTKPTNPLFDMTSLPTSVRYTHKRGLEGKKTRVYWWYNYDQSRFDCQLPVTPARADPDWDKLWLDLRLNVQEQVADFSSSIAEYKLFASGFQQYAGTLAKIAEAVNDVRKLRKGKIPKRFQKLKGRGRRKLPPEYREALRDYDRRTRLDLGDVSNTHLAVHFGIKPAVSDLVAAKQVFDKLATDPPVVKCSAQVRDVQEYALPYSYDRYLAQIKEDSSLRAVVWVKPHILGFDIGTPEEWAWELIPFSFVIDWGIGIGDWLTAQSAMHNVDVASSVCVTRLDKVSSVCRNVIDDNLEDGKAESTRYSRSIYLNGVPMPTKPEVKITKSLLAVQHGLALLHQLRRNRNIYRR